MVARTFCPVPRPEALCVAVFGGAEVITIPRLLAIGCGDRHRNAWPAHCRGGSKAWDGRRINGPPAAQGTGEVSANITQVTEAATETGDASRQVLEAAGELSREAENLRTRVDNFVADIKAA